MIRIFSAFFILGSLASVSSFADVYSCKIVGQTVSSTLVFNSKPDASESAVIMNMADRAPVGAYSSLYADNNITVKGKAISLLLLDRTPINWAAEGCYKIQFGERVSLTVKSDTELDGTVEQRGTVSVDPARAATCSVPRIARPPEQRFECKKATLSVTEE